MRLKANKTSLYNLVATYKPLPGMRRVDFQKANGRPDYWLEWTTDDGHTKAFLSSSLGHPILTITTHDVIYADPPWAYSQGGNTKSSHGIAKQHYPTMTTAEICALPVREIVRDGAACFMWATFPNITEAIKVMEAWGFTYKTAAFVWVKKNRKQGGNFMGLGAYTRANAEVCLLGVTPGFKAKTQIRAHNVHQIIEAPFEGHSKKPDETRQRIVELLGDVPRLEMFARQRADGWDAWGNEAPEA